MPGGPDPRTETESILASINSLALSTSAQDGFYILLLETGSQGGLLAIAYIRASASSTVSLCFNDTVGSLVEILSRTCRNIYHSMGPSFFLLLYP